MCKKCPLFSPRVGGKPTKKKNEFLFAVVLLVGSLLSTAYYSLDKLYGKNTEPTKPSNQTDRPWRVGDGESIDRWDGMGIKMLKDMGILFYSIAVMYRVPSILGTTREIKTGGEEIQSGCIVSFHFSFRKGS